MFEIDRKFGNNNEFLNNLIKILNCFLASSNLLIYSLFFSNFAISGGLASPPLYNNASSYL